MSTIQKAVTAALTQQAIYTLKTHWDQLSQAQVAQLKLIIDNRERLDHGDHRP